jgi:hypothetical protein
VTWVAAASYLTRAEARERFKEYSGDEYQTADYRVDRDAREVGGADNRERAKFWEIWDKKSRRVVWVADGCENILDEDDPHLDLSSYWPCPQPVYGTLQRGSLVPVPDVMQYKDQLEELNLLTSKIHALSDALEGQGVLSERQQRNQRCHSDGEGAQDARSGAGADFQLGGIWQHQGRDHLDADGGDCGHDTDLLSPYERR